MNQQETTILDENLEPPPPYKSEAEAKELAPIPQPLSTQDGAATSSSQLPSVIEQERADAKIITETINDLPLLLSMMIQMGLPGIIDQIIPHRWNQRALSWGWTATIWLAFILSEGDHRKLSVAEFIDRTSVTIAAITGQTVDPLDFDDDRLTHLLTHLSKPEVSQTIEDVLSAHTIEIYELPKQVIRIDPTTVSGYHETKEGGTFQFGHSKDDPNRPQIKIATAALDPLGMPLATEVVPGNKSDDGLYVGFVKRVIGALMQIGLLFVGDCKMSSLENRQEIAATENFYLTPLAMVGDTAKDMQNWITVGIQKCYNNELTPIYRENSKGEIVFIAAAYEVERQIPKKAGEGEEDSYVERVIVVYSPAHATQQAESLETRLDNAKQAIEALTPPRKDARRKQIVDEEVLKEAIDRILEKYQVKGLLTVEYEREVEIIERYKGAGRGSAQREKCQEERVRYQIIAVTRNEAAIIKVKERYGWKAFVTNATQERLPMEQAVLCYRNEYRIERIFNRLKSRFNIAPLYVQRDDQVAGLTYLLCLGVRVLSLIEFVVRRSLKEENKKLPDLHPENKKKETDKPTAERLLKAFRHINLNIFLDAEGKKLYRWLPPLSRVQQAILNALGLGNAYDVLRN